MVTVTREPNPSSMLERDLERRLEKCLLLKRREFRSIHIEAEDGDVRLTGEVGSFYLRQVVVSSALQVAGVVRVIDLIEVTEPAENAHCLCHRPQVISLPDHRNDGKSAK